MTDEKKLSDLNFQIGGMLEHAIEKELRIYYEAPPFYSSEDPYLVLTQFWSMDEPLPKLLEILRLFFMEPSHHEFLLCTTTSSLETKALHLKKPIDDLLQECRFRFGWYEDSLMGIENFIQNAKEGSMDLMMPSASLRTKKVLFIGAGPSLRDHIEIISKWKGAIVCVDAAYPALVHHGIAPHFVITAERGLECTHFFKGMERAHSSTVLLANAFTHPETIQCWQGRHAFILRDSAENALFFPKASLLNTDPYVGQFAYSFILQYLRPHMIYCLGMDWVFHPESGKSHAIEFFEENKEHFYDVTTFDGSIGKSTFFWCQFGEDVERIMGLYPEIRWINGTKWARALRGSEYMPPSEWIGNDEAYYGTHKIDFISREPLNELSETLEEFESFSGHIEALSQKKRLSSFLFQIFVSKIMEYKSLVWSNPKNKASEQKRFEEFWERVKKDLSAPLEVWKHRLSKDQPKGEQS